MLKKILITILILVNISSKTIPILEFAKETDFNEETTQFNVDYEGEETSLLVYLTQKNQNINLVLTEEEDKISGESYDFKYPGGGAVYSLSEENTHFLNIITKDAKIENGKIWATPLNNEIEIDLSKTYEQNFTVQTKNLYGKDKKLIIQYPILTLIKPLHFTIIQQVEVYF